MAQIVRCRNCGKEFVVTGLVLDYLRALPRGTPQSKRVVPLSLVSKKIKRCCGKPELEWGLTKVGRCPYCGSSRPRHIRFQPKWTLVRCRRCRRKFKIPRSEFGPAEVIVEQELEEA